MIIVTGGAGFIGSSIIAALNMRQITDILVVDQLGVFGYSFDLILGNVVSEDDYSVIYA